MTRGPATIRPTCVCIAIVASSSSLPICRAEARMAKQTDVARLAADAAFVKALGVESKTLEGYLFPDTYHFPRRTKPEDVLRAMVHRFKEAHTPELRAKAAGLGMQ